MTMAGCVGCGQFTGGSTWNSTSAGCPSIHPQCPCFDPSHIKIFIYYSNPHIIFTYYNPICNPLINLYISIPIKILTDSTPGERSAGDWSSWSSLWRAEEGVGLAQDESCKTQVADLRVAPGDTSLVAANSMAIRIPHREGIDTWSKKWWRYRETLEWTWYGGWGFELNLNTQWSKNTGWYRNIRNHPTAHWNSSLRWRWCKTCKDARKTHATL